VDDYIEDKVSLPGHESRVEQVAFTVFIIRCIYSSLSQVNRCIY